LGCLPQNAQFSCTITRCSAESWLLLNGLLSKLSGQVRHDSRLMTCPPKGPLLWYKVCPPLIRCPTLDRPIAEFSGFAQGDGRVAPKNTRRCHTAIINRQATAIIPFRKNGRAWKEACPAAIARNETLRATRNYGRAFLRPASTATFGCTSLAMAGRDITPAAASRQRCPRHRFSDRSRTTGSTSRPSENASP
jgi:hypothetical protein